MYMKAPKNWKEVTINQYYNLIDVIDLPLSDEDKALAMLSALTDKPIEYLTNDIGITELSQALKTISFIDTPKVEGKVKPTFKCGGKKFYFDLVLRDGNASSFISLSEQLKDPVKTKKNLHNVMAIFCHELNWFGFKKKRSVQSQKEIAEFFKVHMNMNDAFLYRDFFLLSYKTLSKATLDYLDKKQKEIMKTLKKEMSNLRS